MSVLKWIKDKYTQRRADKIDTDPWWVTLMLDIGRPLIAILILTMCAPGEHYLAMEAGWSETLAWGMPGTLTAYAGIAAVVATKRTKGTPGRKTAITGAVISIALAMAAQPIAHLYGRHGLTPQAIWLTISAGLIPAAVFGHLLHMGAASPKPDKAAKVDALSETAPAKATTPPDTLPGQIIRDNGQTRADVLDKLAARTVQPDLSLSVFHADRNGHRTDTPPEQPSEDVLSEIEPVSVRPVSGTVRSINKPTLSADIRTFLSAHPDADDADLAAAMAVKWPDKPWASVQRIKNRYKEKQEKSS